MTSSYMPKIFADEDILTRGALWIAVNIDYIGHISSKNTMHDIAGNSIIIHGVCITDWVLGIFTDL